MRAVSRRLSKRIPFRSSASANRSSRLSSLTQSKEKTFPHYAAPEEDEPIVQIETSESTEVSNGHESESDWETYDIDTSPSRFIEDEDFHIAIATDDDDGKQEALQEETGHSNGDQSPWTSFYWVDFIANHLFTGACSMHSISGNRLTKTKRPKAVSLQSFLAKVWGQDSSASLTLNKHFTNTTEKAEKSKYYEEAVVRVYRRIHDKSKLQSRQGQSRLSVQAEFPDSVIRKLERLAVLRKRRDSGLEAVKLGRKTQSFPSKKAVEIFHQHNRIRSMVPEDSADSVATKEVNEATSGNRKHLLRTGTSQCHSLSVEGQLSRQSGSSRVSTRNETMVKNEAAEDECDIAARERSMEDEEKLVQPSQQTYFSSATSSVGFGEINVAAVWRDFMCRISGEKSI